MNVRAFTLETHIPNWVGLLVVSLALAGLLAMIYFYFFRKK